jgi:hypothetical protein
MRNPEPNADAVARHVIERTKRILRDRKETS